MSAIKVDTLVLGGGLAGSMVALELAREGRQAVLLERTKGAHNKVCGEFLSGEAIHYLARHGIDLPALGGIPLDTVRLVLGKAVVEGALPFAAYSLTRTVLDEEMLRLAVAAGVDVQRNVVIEDVEQADGGWSAAVRDGRRFEAKDAFLATGKHDVRGWPRPEGTHKGLVAFKMYYKLTSEQHRALGSAIELVLFKGGYAGLQPIEGGRVNLCLLVTAKALQAVGSGWGSFLPYLLEQAPHLEERLRGAVPLLDAPLAASRIPYGHVQATATDGLWRVGDQAAVVPSFCGDGMSIALHSGALAARHFLRGGSSRRYQQDLKAQLGFRLSMATRVSQLIVGVPQVAQLVRVVPGLLSCIGHVTRIPESALLSGRFAER